MGSRFALALSLTIILNAGCELPKNGGSDAGSSSGGGNGSGGGGGTSGGGSSGSTTYDLDLHGVPRFVTHNYIDLSRVAKVTPFRGIGWGHDYSDGTESCRTMKHYFFPSGPGSTWPTVPIYSPVNGTVTRLDAEQSGGTQVHIQSSEYPAFTFILFHVGISGLTIGTQLTAGQAIGTHAVSTTTSDIAVSVYATSGFRLVSYFDTMTDTLFADYQARGASSRDDFIISPAARDADSAANNVTCDSYGYYSNPGSLPAWVTLN